MSDDVLLILVAVSQLAFGMYLGWLMWGRAPKHAVLEEHPEPIAPNPSNVRRRP